MRFKFVGLFAALALVAACSSSPDSSGSSGGSGGSGNQPVTGNTGGGSNTGGTAARLGPKAGTQGDLVVNVGDRVFFGYDQYNLNADARAILEKQAAWLKKYPSVTVAVEGHCDERGTREYNLALGERRAAAVKDYLTALGVPRARISTISYGKERPVALGSNEAAWTQNRRGVTVVTGGAGS